MNNFDPGHAPAHALGPCKGRAPDQGSGPVFFGPDQGSGPVFIGLCPGSPIYDAHDMFGAANYVVRVTGDNTSRNALAGCTDEQKQIECNSYTYTTLA